jgi:two-component system OmpR family response regulator
MRSDKIRAVSLNLDGSSTASPDVARDVSRALASDLWRRSGARNPRPVGPPTAQTGIDLDPLELADRLARLERLLRQWQVEIRETILQVGPLELDLIERLARRGERTIELLPQEFRLLKYMMQHSDQLLSRSTLLAEVWQYKLIPKTNLVDVHMGRLRHKVDRPNERPMIQNIRGAGFILRTPS